MAELSISSEIYEQATACAQEQGTSVTAIVEQFLSHYVESYKKLSGNSNSAFSEESLMTEQRLFSEIRDVILTEQLYCDIGFGRQSVMDRFHLSKDRVGTIFSQGSTYANVSDFVNDCRLNHARRLLIEKPELSIQDVAVASGFGLRTTFTRSFKQKYGVTPSDFRNQQHC